MSTQAGSSLSCKSRPTIQFEPRTSQGVSVSLFHHHLLLLHTSSVQKIKRETHNDYNHHLLLLLPLICNHTRSKLCCRGFFDPRIYDCLCSPEEQVGSRRVQKYWERKPQKRKAGAAKDEEQKRWEGKGLKLEGQ